MLDRFTCMTLAIHVCCVVQVTKLQVPTMLCYPAIFSCACIDSGIIVIHIIITTQIQTYHTVAHITAQPSQHLSPGSPRCVMTIIFEPGAGSL
ncbi:hypothetical protein F5B18DRAFT_628469 [Nemania serpens]|nr:hypothetical protein F5B18DRAFT_628469 [Nemania serpens]